MNWSDAFPLRVKTSSCPRLMVLMSRTLRTLDPGAELIVLVPVMLPIEVPVKPAKVELAETALLKVSDRRSRAVQVDVGGVGAPQDCKARAFSGKASWASRTEFV
jgi:hypothetical protein